MVLQRVGLGARCTLCVWLPRHLAHACRLLLLWAGLLPWCAAAAAGAEVEVAIDAVEWLGKSEEELRDVLLWATFLQWPVRGARAMLRCHEPLLQCCWCCQPATSDLRQSAAVFVLLWNE